MELRQGNSKRIILENASILQRAYPFDILRFEIAAES